MTQAAGKPPGPGMALRGSPGRRLGLGPGASASAASAASGARSERKRRGMGQRDWLENARRTCNICPLRLVARDRDQDHQGTSVHQAAMVLLAEVVDASPKSDTFYSPWVETVPQVEALIAAQCETVEFCLAAFASAGRAREGDFGGGAPSMNAEAPEARPVWLCDTWREVVAEPTRGAFCRAIRCQTKRTVLRYLVTASRSGGSYGIGGRCTCAHSDKLGL